MRRRIALLLLCALLFGTLALLCACDGEPSDVVIGGDEIIPNERDESGDTGGDDSAEADDGIGTNKPVDLPYLPV